MDAREYVGEILTELGITGRYRGRHIATELTCMALAEPARLQSIRHRMYIPLAEKQGYTWQQIDRNLRTAISRAWKFNRSAMQALSFYPLRSSPTAKEFIVLLVNHVRFSGKVSQKPGQEREDREET